MEYLFDIGGILFNIHSARWDKDKIPNNFLPFVCGSRAGNEVASLHIERCEKQPVLSGSEPLSTSYNDLGRASLYDSRDGWTVALTPAPGEYPRIMKMNNGMREATLWLNSGDPYYDFVINSMSRIFFSQYAASRKALMLHASVVEAEGKGFIFMGESGIGKSTHSRLWTETFRDCTLLNDDCPLVVAGVDGGFTVAGTPWSGKTPCYRNKACSVGGISRLRQASSNRFVPLDGIEAFVSFIPGMSVMTAAKKLYSDAVSTALDLLGSTRFGILECRPDRDAAVLNRSCLTGNTSAFK